MVGPGMFDGLYEMLITVGVVIGVAVCLLFWGGCKLYKSYSVKIEKKVPASVTVTNVVTITNFVNK